ncbi:LuxR C-terminal-related transcriptional regulator [Propioniciclava sp.]|uniref:helix-turn-helix transcriptional regulator n=1 Tax=Propioniciclava sp. TaxID=2038686 RepID=UPI00344B79D1
MASNDSSGPEIAAQLFVSINTLRSHTKSIYSKLGVRTRRAAVSHAQDRGLL